MIRIGILGSDSSHALEFSKLCNLPNEVTGDYNFPNVRITSIFGLNAEETKKVAGIAKIEKKATTTEELLDEVDAVMILFRDGKLHKAYALPFIKKSIPTWIDKPFTVDIGEGNTLIQEAIDSNCLITGGSTCKYSKDVLELKRIAESEDLGNQVSGYLNFPGDINSPYNGLHFYGPHMAEMLFTIFGYEVKSVTAHLHNKELICMVHYENKHVILNFTKEIKDSTCIIHGDKKSHIGSITIDTSIYMEGLSKFIQMIKTKEMPLSPDKLVAATVLISAIEESLKSGEKVYLDSFI